MQQAGHWYLSQLFRDLGIANPSCTKRVVALNTYSIEIEAQRMLTDFELILQQSLSVAVYFLQASGKKEVLLPLCTSYIFGEKLCNSTNMITSPDALSTQ